MAVQEPFGGFRGFLAGGGDIFGNRCFHGLANLIEAAPLHGDVEIGAKCFPITLPAACKAKDIAHGAPSSNIWERHRTKAEVGCCKAAERISA